MHQSFFQFTSARYTSQKNREHCRLQTRHVIPFTLILIIAACTLPPATAKEQIVRSMSEIESGTLLFHSDDRSHYLRAPLVETSVKIGVQGLLARTVVEQQFSNNSPDWVEGIYAFPLPDNASVDALTMVIGESTVEGRIQPREKARANYETAKNKGKKASLLEQQRPNLFTTRVANIPPGESITIRIHYQSSVRYVDGQFNLNFPLTITPRYIPAKSLSYDRQKLSTTAETGWTTISQLQDTAEITPPMTDITAAASIVVTLDTGLSGLTIESSTHDIITTASESADNDILEVTLANRMIPTDRDFKLTWTPQSSTAPVAAVFRQDSKDHKNSESFASIMVMPPQQIYSDDIPSRDVVFVIDTSQSMSGNSIRQARRMLALGIERLGPNDFFNVIAFNNTSSKLFSRSVQATQKNKTLAIKLAQSLNANGGTEILGALQSALQNKPQSEKLHQIVFITDGSVGNEDEIFTYLHNNLGTSRLFTVGIGSAPNTWFMRKSAELGKGTYTSIANTTELAEKALALLEKLEQPAITDVKVRFNTLTPPEVYPATMPDIYMGEPLLADARWDDKVTEGDIEITGTFAGQTWTQTIRLGSLNNNTSTNTVAANNEQGLDKLWAHRKIQALEDSLLFNGNIEQVKSAITEIALDYSMVTKYTSLVAIEDTVSRDTASKSIHSAQIPQTIPAGNTMHYPQGSLGTTIRFLIALLFIILALFLKRTRRQIDTSVVCTPIKSEAKKC